MRCRSLAQGSRKSRPDLVHIRRWLSPRVLLLPNR